MRDRDVRAAVRGHLDSLHRDDASTCVVEEMGIWAGTVRIDIAVINGELAGFELKSDRDTLVRLPTQAGFYSRVFDRVTLVVGTRHVEKAQALVPDWWSVMSAAKSDDAVALLTTRVGTKNPDPDPFLVAELLWKGEALAVLEEFGLAKGWRSKPVVALHTRLSAELPYSVLSERVRSHLKRRHTWLRKPVSN